MLQKLGLAKSPQSPQGPMTLAHLLPSACLDLDATIGASYDGAGQLWHNLVAAPADGSATGAYHFYRGSSAAAQGDDPAFTGAPGDAQAYWLMDGGDGFKQTATTPLVANLHKVDSTGFTMIAAFRHELSSGEQRLFSTQANGGSSPGITMGISGVKRLFLRQCGDSGTTVASLMAVTLGNADYACIISHDRLSNQTRLWVNSRTQTALTHNYQTATGTALTPVIGARATFDLEFLTMNTRLYSFGLLNAPIGDTEAGLIYDLLNARHNRIYA